MDEKLQRLATKIVGLIKGELENPQDCFEKFAIVYKSQYDYFQNFEPSNLLKLIFYIYSFKNTGNFFTYDEKEALKATLQKHYEAYKRNELKAFGVGLQQYSRKNLTQKLSEII